MERETIGFYGGTFDPIHFGHINLALQLLEIHRLKAVLFCPAYCSPFKTAEPPQASPQQRLEMLRLALDGIPHFQISSYEVERNDPSFTIDTIRAIKGEVQANVQFRLLLSEEAATHFDQWKEFQELIRLAPPLIGMRASHELKEKFIKALRSGFTPTKIFDISSTEIRARLKKGLYCGHLVPGKVLDYIQTNHLYRK